MREAHERGTGDDADAELDSSRLLHPLRDQDGHPIVVTASGRPLRRRSTGLMPGDYPLHGLMRGPRDLRVPTVGACLALQNDLEQLGGGRTCYHSAMAKRRTT
jgi:hypothetical protein